MLAKTPEKVLPIGFTEDVQSAAFRSDKDPQKANILSPLRDWLLSLEAAGQDIQSLEFACHTVEPSVSKDFVPCCFVEDVAQSITRHVHSILM